MVFTSVQNNECNGQARKNVPLQFLKDKGGLPCFSSCQSATEAGRRAAGRVDLKGCAFPNSDETRSCFYQDPRSQFAYGVVPARNCDFSRSTA